jgi:hypothetical protein
MSRPTLDRLRDCLKDIVPAVLATCDSTGRPSVSLVSRVHYVNPESVAIGCQFFNKTRRNVLRAGQASVAIIDPIGFGE